MVSPSLMHETHKCNHRCKGSLFSNDFEFFVGQVIGNSLAFSLGLATTLALLGIAASFAGKAYGQIGQGLPLAASGLAVIMGLNLLEVFSSYYC